jgi:hypothetical protein
VWLLHNSPVLVTLMMEALRYSETSVLTKATRHTSQKTAFFRAPYAQGFTSLYPEILFVCVDRWSTNADHRHSQPEDGPYCIFLNVV